MKVGVYEVDKLMLNQLLQFVQFVIGTQDHWELERAYPRSGADGEIDWLVFWADGGGEVVVALLALCERYVESWLAKRKAWN